MWPLSLEKLDPHLFRKLPASVGLNLALLLTDRRRAFQIDIEDIDDDAQTRVIELCEEVSASLGCHGVRHLRHSLSGPGRRFWTIVYHESGMTDEIRELKQLLMSKGADTTETAALRLSDEGVVTRSGTVPTAYRIESWTHKVYTLIGQVLGLSCDAKEFLKRHAKQYRIIIKCSIYPVLWSCAESADVCGSEQRPESDRGGR